MAKPLVTDALWERIHPLLPPRPKPKRPDRPGRPPIEDRTALTGILFASRPESTGRIFRSKWVAALV